LSVRVLLKHIAQGCAQLGAGQAAAEQGSPGARLLDARGSPRLLEGQRRDHHRNARAERIENGVEAAVEDCRTATRQDGSLRPERPRDRIAGEGAGGFFRQQAAVRDNGACSEISASGAHVGEQLRPVSLQAAQRTVNERAVFRQLGGRAGGFPEWPAITERGRKRRSREVELRWALRHLQQRRAALDLGEVEAPGAGMLRENPADWPHQHIGDTIAAGIAPQTIFIVAERPA